MVLESAAREFVEVDHVGVVIRETANGFHSGLLYRLDGDARILHLAFHYDLRDELAVAPYRWANLGLDDDNKVVLASYLAKVMAGNPNIPYGFDLYGQVIDPATGDLLPAPGGNGLTCATFILAILRVLAHELITISDWPERTEDTAFQQRILEMLEGVADDEHIDLVRQDVGAKRIRPDEVVGAAVLSSVEWPVGFASARELADKIISDLAV